MEPWKFMSYCSTVIHIAWLAKWHSNQPAFNIKLLHKREKEQKRRHSRRARKAVVPFYSTLCYQKNEIKKKRRVSLKYMKMRFALSYLHAIQHSAHWELNRFKHNKLTPMTRYKDYKFAHIWWQCQFFAFLTSSYYYLALRLSLTLLRLAVEQSAC